MSNKEIPSLEGEATKKYEERKRLAEYFGGRKTEMITYEILDKSLEILNKVFDKVIIGGLDKLDEVEKSVVKRVTELKDKLKNLK